MNTEPMPCPITPSALYDVCGGQVDYSPHSAKRTERAPTPMLTPSYLPFPRK